MRYIALFIVSFMPVFCESNVSLEITHTDYYVDVIYAIFMIFCLIFLVFIINFLRNEFKQINDVKIEEQTTNDIKNENFLASNNPENIINLSLRHKDYVLKRGVSNIDIFSRLDYVSQALFEESFKSKSIIIFDFDDNLDRNYNINSQQFIKCFVSCIKFFLQEFKNSTILVEFLMLKEGSGSVNFSLKISSNNILNLDVYEQLKNVIQKKETISMGRFRYIHEINSALKDLIWDIKCQNIDNFGIIFEGFLKIVHCKEKTKESCIEKFKDLSSILICTNQVLKNTLIKQMDKIGVDIKPCANWNILNKHIEDAIYTPSIVFIYTEDYNCVDTKILESLKVNKEKKNFIVVFLIGNKAQIISTLEIGNFFITTPYVLETLKNVLDMSYEMLNENKIVISKQN